MNHRRWQQSNEKRRKVKLQNYAVIYPIHIKWGGNKSAEAMLLNCDSHANQYTDVDGPSSNRIKWVFRIESNKYWPKTYTLSQDSWGDGYQSNIMGSLLLSELSLSKIKWICEFVYSMRISIEGLKNYAKYSSIHLGFITCLSDIVKKTRLWQSKAQIVAIRILRVAGKCNVTIDKILFEIFTIQKYNKRFFIVYFKKRHHFCIS